MGLLGSSKFLTMASGWTVLWMVKESDGLDMLEARNQFSNKEDCSICVSCYREVQKQKRQSFSDLVQSNHWQICLEQFQLRQN